MLPYIVMLIFIATICLILMIVLWLYMVKRQLASLLINIEHARKQLQLHQSLLEFSKDDEDKRMFTECQCKISKNILSLAIEQYNVAYCHPLKRSVAWVFGYKKQIQ